MSYGALNYNMKPVRVVESVPKVHFGPVLFILGSVIPGIILFGSIIQFFLPPLVSSKQRLISVCHCCNFKAPGDCATTILPSNFSYAFFPPYICSACL